MRLTHLDGLRGILALSVFIHHGAIYYSYIQNGVWGTPWPFFAALGPVAVFYFFMVTGFLFWGQVLAAEGRLKLSRLYVGRIFRLGPLFLAAVAVLFLMIAIETHFTLRVSPKTLLINVLKWSSLGWTGVSEPINGATNGSVILLGTWTLRYEWMFYASLALTAYLARVSSLRIGLPAIGLLIAFGLLLAKGRIEFGDNTFLAGLFCTGMLCAATAGTAKSRGRINLALSAMVVLLVVCEFALVRGIYSVISLLIVGGSFFLITRGADIWGLLRTRPMVRLGNISFGVYLLQGLILAPPFALQSVRQAAAHNQWVHWAVVAACGVVLLVVATLAHVLIERPGIELGKSLLRPRAGPKANADALPGGERAAGLAGPQPRPSRR